METSQSGAARLTIRAAGSDDVEALLQMFGALDDQHRVNRPDVFCGSSQRPRPPDYVTGLLAAPDCGVLVAELHRRLVGLVVVRMREEARVLLVPRRYGEIDALFVAAQARQQGVGRALLRAAEEWVLQQGGTTLELVVWEFNQAAIRLYETRGYTTSFRRLHRLLKAGD